MEGLPFYSGTARLSNSNSTSARKLSASDQRHYGTIFLFILSASGDLSETAFIAYAIYYTWAASLTSLQKLALDETTKLHSLSCAKIPQGGEKKILPEAGADLRASLGKISTTSSRLIPKQEVPYSHFLSRSLAPSLPYLSPDAGCVVEVMLVVGELSNAVVDGHAASSRGHFLFGHLHPTQGAHGETLAAGRGAGGEHGLHRASGQHYFQERQSFQQAIKFYVWSFLSVKLMDLAILG